MLIKNKVIRRFLYVILALIGLYSGISCFVTLHKANTQPYLLSETIRYVFMGYYMMAAVNGGIFAVSVVLMILLFITGKKDKSGL